MNTGSEQDSKTLSWVKSELDETLKQARHALENYVQNPNDAAQLQFLATYIHQVVGTLQMVEMYGAALFAEEIEQVVNALLDEKLKQREDAFEILMRSLLQLPAYLEHILLGNKDLPITLLPILNDLRATRGEQLLSENALFSPDLSILPKIQADKAILEQDDIQRLAKKLRPLYQAGLVGLFRNTEIETNLKRLATAIKQLESIAADDTIRQFWWICGGVIEALFEKGLELNISIRTLLAQIDRLIKKLVDGGESELRDEISKELLKNLLYYIAQAKSQGKQVSELKKAFDLGKLLPNGEEKEAQNALFGLNTEILQNVSKAIKEDVLTIKDDLDIFVRSNDRPVSELIPLAEKLHAVSDTLGMLGLGKLRKLISEQEAIIRDIVANNAEIEDSVVMGIASALLVAESSMDDLRLEPQEAKEDEVIKTKSSSMPEAEYRQLVHVTIAEAKSVLARIKDTITAFAADQSRREILDETPNLMSEIKGAFVIMSFGRAANLINSCNKYILQKLIAEKSTSSPEELDSFADVITGIEYFLENIERDSDVARKSLDVAQEALIKLGFPPEQAEESSLQASGEQADIAEIETEENIEPIKEIDLEPQGAADDNAATSSSTQETPKAASFLNEDIDEEVLDIFLEEADEELESIALQLDNWQRDLADNDALTTLRRSFHTLKGSGRIVGAMDVGELAWAIENMLNRVIDGTIKPIPPIFEVINQARSAVPELVKQLKGGGDPNVNIQAIIEIANKLAAAEPVEIPEPAQENSEIEEIEAVEPVEALDESRISDQDEQDQQAEQSSPFDPVLLNIFTNETKGHLASVRLFIDQCAKNNGPCYVDESLIRALHTMHGSAHMAGVMDISELTDHLEKYIKTVYENQSKINQYTIGLLVESTQAIEEMIGLLHLPGTMLVGKTELIERANELLDAEIAIQKEYAEAQKLEEEGSDDELVKIFLNEADEIISQTQSYLLEWKNQSQNPALVDDLRRGVHTLHGGAKIAEQFLIADVCNNLEILLSKIIDGQIPVSDQLIDLVQVSHSWLKESFASLKNDMEVEPAIEIIKEIQEYTDTSSKEPEMEHLSGEVDFESALEELREDGRELVEIFVGEAKEFLHRTENLLNNWDKDVGNLEIVKEMQREFYTLKGGARMADVGAIGDLSLSVEMLLSKVVSEEFSATSQLIKLIKESHDWIVQSINALSQNETIVPAQNLIGRIEAFTAEPEINEHQVEAETHELDLSDLFPEHTDAESVDEALQEADSSNDEAEIEEITLEESAVKSSDDDSFAAMFVDEQPHDTGAVENLYEDDLIEIFLEEASEILGTVDELLHRWIHEPDNKEIVGEMQRALHTLKGGARMAKITPVGDLSHSIETALENIVAGKASESKDLLDLIQTSHDWLLGAIDRIKDNQRVGSSADLIEQIEVAIGIKPQPEPKPDEKVEYEEFATTDEVEHDENSVVASLFEAVETAEHKATEQLVQPQAAKSAGERVRVSAELLDNMVNHAGELSIYRSRIELQLGSVAYNLTELGQTISRLRDQLRKFEIEAEAQILFRYEETSGSSGEDFDPLELDRFSNMQQLSRSLLESVGDLSSIQKLLDNYTRESEILLLQQSRINTDLQNGLMRTRLVPFSGVVPRLRRIVRQTSKEVNKLCELRVTGDEGEMDRSVLNRLIPALEHMLRNAIDHGIESQDTRAAANKQQAGQIQVRFSREGSEIVLRIQDDGAGIDLDAIRKKAIERDLMHENADLSDNEVMQFVLESGFSTAKEITQISGRGVGMDVVNTEIKQLGGSLHIDSEKGQGTTFTLRLPLTVSINQALLVNVGEQIYAIPLSTVAGVIRVTYDELKTLHENTNPKYEYAGNKYQFFHLGSVLGVSIPQLPTPGAKVPLILARAGDHLVALQVEAISGRQEIVIKSVGQQISSVKGISGATIMGDGGVVLILDIASLVRVGFAHIKKTDAVQKIEKKAAGDGATIMVVDDSITVRKVTERLLKRHNMQAITAKDGIDAMTKLQEQIPDLMLLDVEMPRMDGFELATAMRNDPRLQHIPIIMITSRTGAKHRERAKNIGVNMYMGKPYQESELMDNIEALLTEHA